jgi:exopolysaccharide biosynthesis polyprenyl glycosylphosphotransferase
VVFACLLLFTFLNIFWRRLFPLEVWGFHLIAVCIGIYFWRYVFAKKVQKRKPFCVLFRGRDALIERGKSYLSSNSGGRFFEISECSNESLLKNGSLQGNPQSNHHEMIVYPFLSKLSQYEMVSLVREKFSGKRVCNSLTFYKNLTGTFPVSELDPQWLVDLSISLTLANQVQQRIKRIIDIFFSFVGILISLPGMAVIALLINLTSKGPVLFVHDRLGLNKRPFKLYKFRTMVDNAEKSTGPVWAKKDDPRVTRLGKILRKTRLDELPQFFNVLKGDMSFVGPRPIRKYFADQLKEKFPYYFLRFYVKPGLTGWAQVSADYGDSVEGQLKKLEHELFYIHDYSLMLDAVIVLKTIQKVLSAKGQ